MPDFLTPDARMYNGPEMDFQEAPGESDEAKRAMDDKLTKLGKYIQHLFHAFENSRTRKKVLDTVKESRKAYYQENEPTNFPWRNASNMISPLTTMGVDELEPRLVSSVIGRDPYIKAVHHVGVSTKEDAEQVTKYDNFILKHKIKIKKFVPDAVHELLIDGTIYPLLSWNVESRKVKTSQFGPDGQRKYFIVELPTEGPSVELIPVEFVWLPDDVNDEDWENAPIIRYVGNLTLGEIKRRSQVEDGWVLTEDLKPYITTQTLKTTQQEADDVQDSYYAYEPNLQPVETLEAYIKWDFFDEGVEEDIIVLVTKDSFKVLRVREQVEVFDQNVKPLRRVRFLKRRGVSWGWPLYTLIAGIQLGVDAMWNRCVNSADIVMTPWGFVKRGMSGVKNNRMMVSPGVLLEVDNPEAFVFPNLGAFNPTSFVPLILQYVTFFERTLNVTDFSQGRESQVAGKKGSTATGTLALLQEGKVKHEYRGMNLQEQFLDLFILIHDLCAANMSPQEQAAICGAPLKQYVTSKAFMFELVGSDLTSNRFVDRQETESMVTTLGPFLQILNPMTLVGDLLKSYNKEPQDYIDPELNKLVQSYIEQKQNTQALVQMGLPEQLAQQATAAGFTPDNVMEFVKQLGSTQAQSETEGLANE